MLKTFFDRSSPIVYLVNFIACAEALVLLYFNLAPRADFPVSLGINSLFLMASWLILNLVDQIPWYPREKTRLGIRVHFQKNIVPVSYLTAVALALKLAG